MTNREFISQVRSTHRLLSSDAVINDRTILSESRINALLLIKRETDKRKLFGSSSLFTLLPCLELMKVPLAECCDYISPVQIARSREKLPRIAEGIYGLLVQSVASVDNRVFLKESTPRRYANILQLQLPNTQAFYWVYNDYLYLTTPDVERINLSCYPEEDVPTALLYPENCPCKPKVPTPCLNPLDNEFRCPGYLLGTVRDMVSQKLMQTYFRIPQDKTTDDVDGQVPAK